MEFVPEGGLAVESDGEETGHGSGVGSVVDEADAGEATEMGYGAVGGAAEEDGQRGDV